MYEPGASARDLRSTQDALQSIQRSELGWAYANAFLTSPVEIVRYFGALTFTLKFNDNSNIVHEEHVAEVYEKVVDSFVQLVEANDSAKVIRKLCSALVAYYLRPSVTWDRIVMRLIRRLTKVSSKVVSTTIEDLSTSVERLNDTTLRSMLWFVEALIHDLAQVDTSSLQGYGRSVSTLWTGD